MRKEFMEDVSKKEAEELVLWAAEIIEVDGGVMCFESEDEAYTWMQQN